MYVIKDDNTILTTVSTKQPWRFQRKDGTWANQLPKLISQKESASNHFKITSLLYETDDGQIQGTRIYIEAGDHSCFILDRLTTEDAFSVYSDFCLDNTDGNSWCNVADKSKLVTRTSKKATKHFYLKAESDGQDILPKIGLLMPYKIDETRNIYYSLYEGLHTFGHNHLNLFGLCHTTAENIKRWHFTEENGTYFVKPSDQSECWCLELQEDTVKVYSQLDPCNVVRVKFE